MSMMFGVIGADGKITQTECLTKEAMIARLDEECAKNEEKRGIPPIITEYCATPNVDREVGWIKQEPATPEEEDFAYGAWGSPVNGYYRNPPNLLQYGLEKLVGRTVVKYRTCVGTYGMGGTGWIALDLEDDANGDRISLVYCLWGADDYLRIPSYSAKWKINSIDLHDRKIVFHCTEKGSNLPVDISSDETPVKPRNATWEWTARKGHGKHASTYKMGELWHVCRPDSSYWSS